MKLETFIARRPLPSTRFLGLALLSANFIVCDPAAAPPPAPDPDPDGDIQATALACGAEARSTSITTINIDPVPNALVLVWVGSTTNDPTNLPVISGAGMSWDLVETHVRNAELRRLSVFRGMSSESAGGSLTIAFGGQEQESAAWGVIQHTGVNTSGHNGSGAIVQTGVADADGFNTSGRVNLNPPSSVGNATVGGFLAGTAIEISPGNGFTELFESGVPRRRVMVEFLPSPSTSVEASWPDPNHWIGIALELRAGSGGAVASLAPSGQIDCGPLSNLKLKANASQQGQGRQRARPTRPPRTPRDRP
jgi:hypothetical protein